MIEFSEAVQSIYIYIYIYKEREREERKIFKNCP